MPFFVHPKISSIWHPSIAGIIGHFMGLGTETDAQLGRRRYRYERYQRHTEISMGPPINSHHVQVVEV